MVELEIRTSDPRFAQLCAKYWATDDLGSFVYKVADLAADLGLKAGAVAQVVREHSVARSAAVTCSFCGRGVELRSRSDVSYPPSLCGGCAEEAEALRVQSATALHAERQDALESHFASAARPASSEDIKTLTLRDAVMLAAAIRCGASEELDRILPVREWPFRLTPAGGKADEEEVSRLFDRGVLRISAQSSPSAFEWVDGEPQRFYSGLVSWSIALVGESREIGSVQTLLEDALSHQEWPITWEREQASVWLDVARAECLSYLELCLADHALPFKPGDKTRLVIETTLQTFSIGQVNNFSWRAAKDAAAFYMRGHGGKNHAANTVVGNIQRAAERAQTEHWQVKSFGRDRRLPASAFSEVVARLMTDLGDEFLLRPFGPKRHRVSDTQAVVADAAGLLGVGEDVVVAGGISALELTGRVAALEAAIDAGAEAFVAAYPSSPGDEAPASASAEGLSVLAAANREVDEALLCLQAAVGVPVEPPPADPLQPRSVAYFVARLGSLATTLEKQKRQQSEAPPTKPHKRTRPKGKRKRRR